MRNFTLSPLILQRMAKMSSFNIHSNDLVFFGLRYAYPTNPAAKPSFQSTQELTYYDWNDLKTRKHQGMACTLGHWYPSKDKIQIFPGSTVPHAHYLRKYRETMLANKRDRSVVVKKSNLLMPGYYPYVCSHHNLGRASRRYEAFRLKAGYFQPVHRSWDDFEFDVMDKDDIIEVTNPSDNIHAASSDKVGTTGSGGGKAFHGSAGCQVVAGWGDSPNNKRRYGSNNSKKWEPWMTFKEEGFKTKSSQSIIWYMLLYGRYAARISQSPNAPLSMLLRYGSTDFDGGDVVATVQNKLNSHMQAGDRKLKIDGDYGRRTFSAVLQFQKRKNLKPDGVTGAKTSAALGFRMPVV